MDSEKKRKPVALKIVLGIVIVVAVLVVAAFLVVYVLLSRIDRIEPNNSMTSEQIESMLNESEDESVPEDAVITPEDEELLKKSEYAFLTKGVTNILLLGVDTPSNVGRSDVMILVSYNKNTNEITMCSFLRDLLVTIPGYDENRLNATYAFGGTELLDECFLVNFGIQIHGHVIVNFDTFPTIIDALGGVDLSLSDAEAGVLNLGSDTDMYHLNGEKALEFVRIRKLDSDFGRTTRQRRLLSGMLDKFGWEGAFNAAIAVLDYCATDMTALEMMNLGAQMITAKGLNQASVPDTTDEYYNAYVRGMAVLVPDLDLVHERLGTLLYSEGPTQ